MNTLPYQLLVDIVLIAHVAVVLFVVGGLVVIIVGNVLAWRWVNALGFRLTHLVAIAVVIAETWLGATCPLTTLEMWLRSQAQLTTYTGSFLAHWLKRILYYDAPHWEFVLVYSLFGVIVVGVWWRFPPKPKHPAHKDD